MKTKVQRFHKYCLNFVPAVFIICMVCMVVMFIFQMLITGSDLIGKYRDVRIELRNHKHRPYLHIHTNVLDGGIILIEDKDGKVLEYQGEI